jgi:dienelactone hydrolase
MNHHYARTSNYRAANACYAQQRGDLRTLVALALTLAFTFVSTSCSDSNGSSDPAPAIDPERFATLFAPPTAEEIVAVRAEWAARPEASCDSLQPAGQDTVLLSDFRFPPGQDAQPGDTVLMTVFSHQMGANVHYAAILQPTGSEGSTLALLLSLHEGVDGGDINTQAAVMATYPQFRNGVALVVPSFRSEPLLWKGEFWQSSGEASPWDEDVDDALASLACAQQLGYGAGVKPGVVGLSRGSGVGLLAVARHPEQWAFGIDFFGPADLFGEDMQSIAQQLFQGGSVDVPGTEWVTANVLQPWADSTLSDSLARHLLLKRSAAYFAASDWPTLLIEHGLADSVVSVEQSRLLAAQLSDAGVEYRFQEWPGVGHTPLGMDFVEALDSTMSGWR